MESGLRTRVIFWSSTAIGLALFALSAWVMSRPAKGVVRALLVEPLSGPLYDVHHARWGDIGGRVTLAATPAFAARLDRPPKLWTWAIVDDRGFASCTSTMHSPGIGALPIQHGAAVEYRLVRGGVEISLPRDTWIRCRFDAGQCGELDFHFDASREMPGAIREWLALDNVSTHDVVPESIEICPSENP